MNLNNFKKALAHFEQMPDDNFDFSDFIECSMNDWIHWGISNEEIKSSEYYFTKYGSVPCGTVACVAGEIYLEFSTAEDREKMLSGNYIFDSRSEIFSRNFLGIDEEKARFLFYEPEAYGRQEFKRITRSDVVKKFKRIIRTKSIGEVPGK